MQNPEKAKDVIVLPLPAPGLSRPLCWSPADESQRLCRVGEVSREIFNNEITPELKKVAPWLLKPKVTNTKLKVQIR